MQNENRENRQVTFPVGFLLLTPMGNSMTTRYFRNKQYVNLIPEVGVEYRVYGSNNKGYHNNLQWPITLSP